MPPPHDKKSKSCGGTEGRSLESEMMSNGKRAMSDGKEVVSDAKSIMCDDHARE